MDSGTVFQSIDTACQLMATTSNSASEMLDDLRLRKFGPTASGTTRITFLPPRPYPRFPHRPRTVSAKWLAGSSSGDRCLRVEGQDPGRNLMLTICRRQGELAGTLEFSGGMMEPWTQLAALTLSNLTGDPEVGVIAAQRQLRLPVSAAATELSRLHFALKELPNGLGSESSLYQLRLDFSPANTQEVLIFVTPEFRSALKHEFSRGSVAGAGH